MPKHVKYTKEQIGDKAFSLVREKGVSSLSARSLASYLGVSTAPIFTAFSSIEELTDYVREKAYLFYGEYVKAGLSEQLPFKAAGLKYIQFAHDEPWLFKMLFMSERKQAPSHYFPESDGSFGEILEIVKKSYSLDEEKAKRLYNHLSVYAHGLAVMFAEKNTPFDFEDVSSMMSEAFFAFKEKIK